MKSPYQTNYQGRITASYDHDVSSVMAKAQRNRRLFALDEISERLAKSSPRSEAENEARNQMLRGIAEERLAIINSTKVSR
jgi:hypothetical protein